MNGGQRFGCDMTSQEEILHQRRFSHTPIVCPQCEQTLARKELTGMCQHCHKDFLPKEMASHQEFCPQNPPEYYNEKRGAPQVCDPAQRPSDLGCDFREPLDILGQHMNDLQHHYMLMCNLVQDMRSENRELREDIRHIKEMNSQPEDYVLKVIREELRLETAKLSEEMRQLFNQIEILAESNLKKDEKINHLGLKMDNLKAALNMEKDKYFQGLKDQREFNYDLELKVNPSMQKLNHRGIGCKDAKLDITEDCEVWLEDKTLEDVKKLLTKQLHHHKEDKKNGITIIFPQKDLNDVWEDVRDLGDFTIGGTEYRCTMVQREGLGGGRRLELGLHQASVLQRWPPPHVSRAMLCVLDRRDSRVLFYSVKRGSLGDSKPYPGMKAMAFGSFYLTREQIVQLSSTNHVSYAFILFSLPS